MHAYVHGIDVWVCITADNRTSQLSCARAVFTHFRWTRIQGSADIRHPTGYVQCISWYQSTTICRSTANIYAAIHRSHHLGQDRFHHLVSILHTGYLANTHLCTRVVTLPQSLSVTSIQLLTAITYTALHTVHVCQYPAQPIYRNIYTIPIHPASIYNHHHQLL